MANDIGSRRDAADVADRVHSAAIHVLRRVRRVDEETGLSAARLSALSVLVFGGPSTLGALARSEQVSPPTMSKLVRTLERDGFVVREPHERDGRAVRLSATSAGRAILREGRARRVSELTELLGSLSAAELGTLAEAADVLERALSRSPSADSTYAACTAERRWSGSE